MEIVIEGTGAFNDLAGSSKHIEAGAKKVVITAPGKNCPTYVCGVNEDKYNPATENVVSNAQSFVEETGNETHQIFPFRIFASGQFFFVILCNSSALTRQQRLHIPFLL